MNTIQDKIAAFKRVSAVPINEPPFGGADERQWAIDYVAAAKRAGITELQVNFMISPFHPILFEDPTKVYHWFSHYAPALDMFAISDLFQGLYPTSFIAMNFQRLKVLAEETVSAGLKPFLYCAEPRFVPERFFVKRPDLRGPRVDNPTHGGTPYFALCTDRKEVRDHYAEMLGAIMSEVPEITKLSLFTTDSGSGFCYNDDLYSGPNGPGHCRKISLIDRIITFCTGLIDCGRKFNPAFEVHINSNVPPAKRAELAARGVDGLHLAVYGWQSWTGGLEDKWAFYQYRAGECAFDLEAARQIRVKDIEERYKAVAATDPDTWALCCLPNEQYYRPLRYVPEPYDILWQLREYRRIGFKNLSFRGCVNTEDQVQYDVNADVFCAFQANPGLSDAELLGGVISGWGAQAAANELKESWRLIDDGLSLAPDWMHGFGRDEYLTIGPIVPDFSQLERKECQYFRHVCFDELDVIKGEYWFIPNLGKAEYYDFTLKQYAEKLFPMLAQAEELLAQGENRGEVAGRVCLEQKHYLKIIASHYRSRQHWVEASAILRGHQVGRPIAEVIEDEIQNTRDFIALLGTTPEKYLDIERVAGCLYMLGPNLLKQLKARIELMEKHRADKVFNIG